MTLSHYPPRKWRAICPDGIIRTAVETRDPDVQFAANARVQYKGLTVQGSVYAYSDAVSLAWADNHPEDQPADVRTGERTVWEFFPYTYLKNGRVWGEHADTGKPRDGRTS